MKLEIDVISTEMVTPSSPIPFHLNNYQLSFFDQIMPRLLMPSVLLYPATTNDHIHTPIISNFERSSRLKKSLSRALALFYPLAGRLVGNSYVNCNDEGVTYVEARANHRLFDVITNPLFAEELTKFVPCDPEDATDLCLVVQATFFTCGGLAIGTGLSHKLADGLSFFMFVNSWAAFSRGGESYVHSPKFESAVLFPPKDLTGENVIREKKETAEGGEKKETLVLKMFTFSSQKIDHLREKYSKNTKGVKGLIHPSRVETLSAFIGTRIMATTGANDDDMTRKVHALRIAIDLRTRLVPPLSEYHFGNVIVAPEITLSSFEDDDEDGTYGIVKKIRDKIRNVKGDDLSDFKNLVEKASKSKAVMCWFSSLCNFPINKVDFGWGKPVWYGIAKIPTKNMVFLTNSLSGGGIDALVNMEEEEMTKFEADEELLEYVSPLREKEFEGTTFKGTIKSSL